MGIKGAIGDCFVFLYIGHDFGMGFCMPLKVVNPLVFLNFLMSVCGGVCWGRFDF